MAAQHGTRLPSGTGARIREHLAHGDQVSAIKPAREHAGPSLKDAKDLANSVAAPGTAPEDAPADLIAVFAAELRHARRMAGNPSYYRLAHLTSYSVPTISRAFAGRTLPRWATALAILQALGIPEDQIDTRWRPQWAQAPDHRNPIPEHVPAGTPPEPPAATAPAAGQARPALPPGTSTCEDCGALIGDLVQHQAWHWRIERQLRKTAIRVVDSTAQ